MSGSCSTCGSCGMGESWLTRLLGMDPCTYGCAVVGDEYAWHPRTWRNAVLERYWGVCATVRWIREGCQEEAEDE